VKRYTFVAFFVTVRESLTNSAKISLKKLPKYTNGICELLFLACFAILVGKIVTFFTYFLRMRLVAKDINQIYIQSRPINRYATRLKNRNDL